MGRKKQTEAQMGLGAAALARFRHGLEVQRGTTLSLRDLAEVTGVNHSRWRAILHGADPRLSTLEKIAASDGISVSQLLQLGEMALEDAAQRKRK